MENKFKVGDVVWWEEFKGYKIRAIVLNTDHGIVIKTERGNGNAVDASKLRLIENGVDQLAAILAVLMSGLGFTDSEKWAIEEKCDKLLDELAQ